MAVIKIENLPVIEDLNEKQSKNIYGGWLYTLGLDPAVFSLDPARFGLDPAKFGSVQEESDSDGTDPAKFS
ncbi:MAG: hypothetical protein KAI17_05740 [Thiotrichaceae bacterium]|nr:hypothetical protein [Thiotrichaceae bacterium]